MRGKRRKSLLVGEGRWGGQEINIFKKLLSDNLCSSLKEAWGEWGGSAKAAEGRREGTYCVRRTESRVTGGAVRQLLSLDWNDNCTGDDELRLVP